MTPSHRPLVGAALTRAQAQLLNALDVPACSVDVHSCVTVVNQAWTAFARDNGGDLVRGSLGLSYVALCARAADQGEADAADVAEGLQQVLDGTLDHASFEQSCPSPDLPARWHSLRITRLPAGLGAALAYVDVSAAKRVEQEILHERLHDPLTGLPNRSLLVDRLTQALRLGSRQHRRVAVAVIDLDRFSRVSDTVGQHTGDAVMSQVALRLAGALAGGETMARMGSDEFALLIGSVDSVAVAAARVRDVLASLGPPVVVGDLALSLTATAGLALADATSDADEVLAEAYTAMRDAKQRGPGRVGTPRVAGRRRAEAELEIEGQLRAGLTTGAFEVRYQPVAGLASGRVTGVEALLRWRHEGIVRMPDTFIHIAEATGLIIPLGAWVFRQACERAASWDAGGLDLGVAVNLSVRQMADPELLESLLSAVRQTGVDPRRITVEVTESTVMEESSAQAVLRGIDAFGASIAVDDFGVGYSSLLYLKQYPIRAVKVDRSFVAGLGHDSSDDAIVASVVGLASSIGAVSIAEGVERIDQYLALRDLGCDFVQGFLLSPAVAADALTDVIAACNSLLDGIADAPRVIRLEETTTTGVTG